MNSGYVFGPLERRGIFLGARLGQLLTGLLTSALVVAVLALWPSPLGAVVALVLVAGAGGATLVSVVGRTVEEWVPVATAFLVGEMTGSHRWLSGSHLRGHRLHIAAWTGHEVREPDPRATPPTKTRPSRHQQVGDGGEPDPNTSADQRIVTAVYRVDAGEQPPPYLRNIQLLAARWREGEIGVVADARHRTYVGVLAARGRSFPLLDAAEKERLLSHWGAVLAGIAREGGPVTRLQWLERTVPDDSETVVRHLQANRTLPSSSAFVSSYLSLLDDAAPQTQEHEAFLAIQVSAVRASGVIRQLGAGTDIGACEVLSRELTNLARSLREAEVEVRGVLSPRMLAAVIRQSVDPQSRGQLAHRTAAHADSVGASPRTALPRRSLASWSSLQTEGAHHATYWVAEWPRTAVGADWMTPLLLGTWARRTVSVVMQPTAPAMALRRVEAARLDDDTTQSLRERLGFRRTVRKRREAENVVRAEEELNEGHRHVALSAYITVTATSARELEVACRDVEQQAGQARLDIRREFGTQDLAFTYTLPLCRGLR
jgi:hypothetical protein